MCLHMYWDVVIAMVICLNVICMSLEHYQMSQVMRRNTKLRLKLFVPESIPIHVLVSGRVINVG